MHQGSEVILGRLQQRKKGTFSIWGCMCDASQGPQAAEATVQDELRLVGSTMCNTVIKSGNCGLSLSLLGRASSFKSGLRTSRQQSTQLALSAKSSWHSQNCSIAA